MLTSRGSVVAVMMVLQAVSVLLLLFTFASRSPNTDCTQFQLPQTPSSRFSTTVESKLVGEFQEKRKVDSESSAPKVLGLTPEQSIVMDSSDIYVSVKTASSLHAKRLPPILLTWMQNFNPKQIHIITDKADDDVIGTAKDLGMNVIVTNCTEDHGRGSLCCKSGWEYDAYYRAKEAKEIDYSWFCHFDDDAYVNVPNLVKLLRKYVSDENLYLGHYDRNWAAPQIPEILSKNYPQVKKKTFYYALGPAYCISEELMRKLPPYFRGGNTFAATCEKTGFPDDATVGTVIELLLHFPMSEINTMLNHLDKLESVPKAKLPDLVTFGYHKRRVLQISSPSFSEHEDPTRFLSYYCLMHPSTSWCGNQEH